MKLCINAFETASRISGVGFDVIQTESEQQHKKAFLSNSLNNLGHYAWRSGGEKHMWEPETITSLQQAARSNDQNAYWEFAKNLMMRVLEIVLLEG